MFGKICMGVVCLASLAFAEKKYGPGEYEIYSEVTKDLTASNFTKAIADLDAWAAKHPNSDYNDNRQILYVQAFYGANQPEKVIDAAGPLISLDKFETANDRIRVLYMAAIAIQRIAEPTEAQRDIAKRAAQRLAALDQPPPGVSATDWEKARADLQAASKNATLHLIVTPIAQSIKKDDCATAESNAMQAIEHYSGNAQVYRYLASAQLCLGRSNPEKYSHALFAYARAASLDPSNAPALEKMYSQYHGADPEGLKELKAVAAANKTPPPGFMIKSSAQVAQEKEAEFERKNPELALWMKIRHELASENGEQYFAATLKDSAIPQLSGTLTAAKPACRPTELLIAIPSGSAEVKLKLDRPLNGKPESGREIRWEGVASAFVKDPFLLTMDTEAAKIDGLKMSSCSKP